MFISIDKDRPYGSKAFTIINLLGVFAKLN